MQSIRFNLLICKVQAQMGIKGRKAADKAAKKAIGMPRMTTITLPYTDFTQLLVG